MNGNGNTNGNGNGNGSAAINNSLGQILISFFSRLFNIAPSQWSRVAECWLITFVFKAGAAIGWTILTASFISKYGIKLLPVLFIINAALIIGSTFVFEKLIMKIKREVLMILILLIGALCLFFATFLYDKDPVLFFMLVIFAESVFFAQFNVFIPILVGDRFTPLESQKTFPFIDSGETLGGVIGGALIGILGAKIPIPFFLFIWIGFLAAVILVIVITNYAKINLPPLPFRVRHEISGSPKLKTKDQVKLVSQGIKQIPFLKGLVLIVFFQWIFMNVLDFQYMKALEQTVTKKYEPTIAMVESKTYQTSVLGSIGDVIGIKPAAETKGDISKRALTVTEQMELTRKMGIWRSIFFAAAFIVQVFLASRLISGLGVVGSMLLNPILMLMSLVGMFLKFGFVPSIIARLNFETTYVLHENAYFASHYAMPKYIRDQAAEFLEGVVRPLGTFIGMFLVLTFEMVFTGRDASLWIHTIMFILMFAVLMNTIRLQSKYTNLSKTQLFSTLPYPEKLDAIEVLSQKGHEDSPLILVQKLKLSAEESPYIRRRIIAALGKFRDYNTLPEILDALYDPDHGVRLEAAHALMNFHNIGEKFYAQAFSRYRLIETLKDVFKVEESAAMRSAIIRLFSLIKAPDTAEFLLKVLESDDDNAKADCIYTLGLFKDPNAAFYIKPYLNHGDPKVRANAMVALWQFPRYRKMLEERLNEMLNSENPDDIKAGIFAVGEIGLSRRKHLLELLKLNDEQIQLETAFALTKLGHAKGFGILLNRFLELPNDQFDHLRRFFHRLKPHANKIAFHILYGFISEELERLSENHKDKFLHEINDEILEKLRRLYTLLDQHEELFVIESAIKQKAENHQIQNTPAIA